VARLALAAAPRRAHTRDLARYLPLTDDERQGCAETKDIFRLGISPYYLSLIDPAHPYCPVRMQSIPVRAEAHAHEGELRDPLGEDRHRPVRAIVHKYPTACSCWRSITVPSIAGTAPGVASLRR